MDRGYPVSKKEYEEYCVDRTWATIILWFIGSVAAAFTWISLESTMFAWAIFCGCIALGCFGAVLIDYLSGPKYIRSITDEVMKKG